MKEKIKLVAKIIGGIVGLFILWAIFTVATNRISYGPSMHQSLLSPSSDVMQIQMDSEDSSYINGRIGETKSMMIEDGAGMMYSVTDEVYLPQETGITLTEKKVIKNGNLNLKVENTENASGEITQIAKEQKGEVFSTNFYERVKGQKSGSITIKVPVENFENTVEKIKAVATQVLSESTTGQDVTEEYTDLQAQLKNKQAEEQSYLKILDQAGDMEDILAVTKQVSRVRGEIERLQGRVRFMDSQTDMSTIYVNLSEDIEIAPVQNDWRPWQVTKKAFQDLINNTQDFVDGTIRFVIVGIPSLIPFLLFVGIVYWIGKKIWKKFKK